MTDPTKKRIRWPKAGIKIPPISVEATLLDRARQIAKTEIRSLSDVLRCAIRDGLDHRDKVSGRGQVEDVC